MATPNFSPNFFFQNHSEWLGMDFKHNFSQCNILTNLDHFLKASLMQNSKNCSPYPEVLLTLSFFYCLTMPNCAGPEIYNIYTLNNMSSCDFFGGATRCGPFDDLIN